MHPVNHTVFGPTGISVTFNNGISVVHGFIVKQTGVSRFKVSDGVNVTTATLAKTPAQLNNGSFAPGIMTIVIPGANGNEHVARLDSKTAFTVEGNRYTWSLDGSNSSASLPNAATVGYP